MTAFSNRMIPPPGARTMAGPIKAAVMLAGLIGLAACGGGGGGTAGGGSGGGGGPTPIPFDPEFLEENATAVTGIDSTIAGHTLAAVNSSAVTTTRTVGTIYNVLTSGSDGPRMQIYNHQQNTFLDTLVPEAKRNRVWVFTDTYTQGSTKYRAIVVMSYDDALTHGLNRHYWGAWMRQREDTGGWNGVNLFNYRFSNAEEALDKPADLPTHNALTGTASFTGGAVGVYTMDGKAGWFSADASVTANFGGDEVDDDDKFTLTGTIENFDLSGHETNNWSVSLAGNPLKSAGTPTGVEWSGTATGIGTLTGAFKAVFGGPAGETPTGLWGTFRSRFSDGRAFGAFSTSR